MLQRGSQRYAVDEIEYIYEQTEPQVRLMGFKEQVQEKGWGSSPMTASQTNMSFVKL